MNDQPIRVLLVEDNPGDARLIREMLVDVKSTSFQWEWVDRLGKGLDRLQRGGIDVVLLDLTMPDSSGLETFTRMHAQNTLVPIIPLTGIDDEMVAVNALRAGAQDYLVKGEVDSKLLAGAIRYAIERKKVEEALRQSEKRYRTLFEATGTATLVVEENARIVLANAEFEKLSGCRKRDLEGKQRWTDFVPDEKVRVLLQLEQSDEHDGEPTPKTYDFKFVDALGTIKHVFATTTAIPGTKNWVVSLLDVTKRKKMEDELLRVRKLESIGIMAGGLAHDFNNILTAILGNISLARMYAGAQEKVRAKLNEAEKGAARAQELTRQLLTFAKGGAPIKQKTSIGELLRDTVNFSLAGSNVRAECSIPEDLWPVEVDEGQISQVINNLVINADQAMPQGGQIELSAENVTVDGAKSFPELHLADGRYVKISVCDQGVGISEQHLPRIFDPYFTTKPKGSGLGLAIAHSIVEKHGGRILAESVLGKGTTFHLYLVACTGVIRARTCVAESLEQGSGRILVMDDEPSILDVCREMLEVIGYSGDFVSEGRLAVEYYEKAMDAGQPYAAVIMDLTVPGGMGGKEAIEKILAIDPCAKAIVSSGYANDPIMAEFRKYGFKGVVPKPYKISELSKTLYSVVTARSMG
ncbi:MAG: response regulator [Desulfomonile tiedjei]|nr:response regulator [Desulfomonile tiedjei]